MAFLIFVLYLFFWWVNSPAIMTAVLNQTIRPEALHGRGAISNHVGRYEKQTRVLVDDGWDDGWRAEDKTPPPLRTKVIRDDSRSIIARNKSPDISFDQSINPYRGCEHGCVYCFARPSHAGWGCRRAQILNHVF